ncbi:MAG TPA: YbaK/EbsC family protein [Dehalococcoidia bacterium]|nr:YbaK/EbsC family protein [Dehalococcoidia bacterium]
MTLDPCLMTLDPALPASAQRVARAARRLGLDIAIRAFPEGTRTAEDAARAIGVEVGQIVKSLVFLADGRPVLCLVSGANRLDPARLAALTGARDVRRASADEVQRHTGFAIGGVPPFGCREPLAVYCDRDLLAYDVVWAAAGTPTTVFAADPQRLAEAAAATVADLKEP